MTYRTLEESNFQAGIIKEIPPWLLPPGALADANNMIFDEPGIARQRNTAGVLSSPATTAFSTALGWAYSQDANTTAIEQLYGLNGKTGEISSIHSTSGAATSAVAASGTNTVRAGRPARHFGFVAFPGAELVAGERRLQTLAGQTAIVATFTSATAVTLTAGSPTITLGGADVTTNLRVGGIISAFNTAAGLYYGRITEITSGTAFKVWPVPTATFATSAAGLTGRAFAQGQFGSGACACSFQNRLLSGNILDPTSPSIAVISDRRVMYSPLPTESVPHNTLPAISVNGAIFIQPGSWPLLNYFDVPGADPIVAMETVSDNELLILTTQGVVVFRGTLATQTTTSAPGITFDISPLNTNAGCLSDLSVQKTPHGVIWASYEGVMLYTGGGRSPIDLTAGKVHTAWRNLTRGTSFAVHGAFYARNHYVVSGISGGTTFSWCFNLDNQTWAFLSGLATDTFNGSPRPTDPSQIYVGRWWDQTGAAPTQTGGHVMRADYIFAPDVLGQTKIEGDGSSFVAFSLKTRTLTGDQNEERILRRLSARYELGSVGVSVTASVGARLDSSETAGTPTVQVGLLSSTDPMNITAQTNATPIVISTVSTHGLQTGDTVDIRGVTTNSNANGHWRIVVITGSTFSLVGSSGNGATTATGVVKKITEQEYECSSVDIGQGHWLSINSSGQVAKFKLHGIRMGAMMFNRAMDQSRG